MIDSLSGGPADDAIVFGAIKELLRHEDLHDVADALEAWQRRKEITFRQMLDRIHREIMAEEKAEGESNDTHH